MSGGALAVLAGFCALHVPLAAQEGSRDLHRSQGPLPVMVKVPYAGFRSEEAPEALSHHLPLPRGFGLLVTEVVRDSPAESAGIQRHDLLLRAGDQQLVNPGQMSALIRSRKPGETMSLTVFRAGKEWEVSLTLWEAEEPQVEVEERRGALREGNGQPLRQLGERVRRPDGPEMDLSQRAAFSRQLLEKTQRMGDEAMRKFREIEPFQFLAPPAQRGGQAVPEGAGPK